MSNQVWETWRDDRLANLTQDRDELLAALRDLVRFAEVWQGSSVEISKARAAIARAEHNEGT